MPQYTVKGGIEGPVNAVPLLEAVCNVEPLFDWDHTYSMDN